MLSCIKPKLTVKLNHLEVPYLQNVETIYIHEKSGSQNLEFYNAKTILFTHELQVAQIITQIIQALFGQLRMLNEWKMMSI